MLTSKLYEAYVADLPFSAIKLCGYEVPFFVAKADYLDVIVKPSSVYYTAGTKPWILIKSITTYGSLTLSVTDLNDDSHYVEYNMTLLETLQGMKVWGFDASVLFTEFEAAVDHTLEMQLHFTTNYTFAIKRFKLVSDTEYDKYLFFNFMSSYDLQDISLKALSTTFNSRGIAYAVKGGVKMGATKFGVEQETFRDQRYRAQTLTAFTKRQATLTVGDSNGVPEYVGAAINALMCCDKIFLNGKRIVRSGDSAPEPQNVVAGSAVLNFSIDVEYVNTPTNKFSIYTL